MSAGESFVKEIVAGVVEQLRADGVIAVQRPKRLFNVDDAAQYLDRTPKAVRKLIEDGKIPVVRLDSRVQIDRKDLDCVIEGAKDRAL